MDSVCLDEFLEEFLNNYTNEDITSPMHLEHGDLFFFVNCVNKRVSPICRMIYKDPFRGWYIVGLKNDTYGFQKFDQNDRIVIVWSNENNRKMHVITKERNNYAYH